MPHVIVKVALGSSDEQKQDLTDRIVDDLMTCMGKTRDSISVAIEEYPMERWKDEVYDPEIVGRASTLPNSTLTKKPGYTL